MSELRMAAPLREAELPCPPGKFGILDTLRSLLGQFCKRCTNHLYTAALGVLKERHNWALHEGSPVLDLTDVPSSAPKYSMPEVHLEGSPALESTGALLSAPTQPILEVLFTSPVRTFVSFVATTCMRRAYAAICAACMNINNCVLRL